MVQHSSRDQTRLNRKRLKIQSSAKFVKKKGYPVYGYEFSSEHAHEEWAEGDE
jgi:hypothetical protein